MSRWAQAVFDPRGGAGQVEYMLARRRSVLAREAVGELAAVVRQDGLDPHRCCVLESPQEVGTARFGLVAVAAHVHPASGPVDCHVEVAPVGLIGHLWQVLDVDVQVAGLIVFERLQGLGLAFWLGLQALQVRDPVPAQTAVQARARDIGVDELAGHDQQIIQRQEQRSPQLYDEHLLRRSQSRGQLVRTVREVLSMLACLPLASRGHRDVVAFGHHRERLRGRLDLGSCARRRACQRVNLTHDCCSCFNEAITSRITSRARKSGQLRTGT